MQADALGVLTLSAEDRTAAVAAVRAAQAISLGDDEPLIAAFAETALGLAEQFIGAALIIRPFTLAVPAVTGWQRLPLAPVRAITGVQQGGAPLASTDYDLELDARGGGWVRLHRAGTPPAAWVSVQCSAGVAEGWAALPAPIRQGAALLASYLYATRDASQPAPAAVTALWRPYRALRLEATDGRA